MILLVLFSGAQLCSCKKYLEEKSNKSLVIPETVSDLQGLFDNDFLMNDQTTGFGEASTDDYFATPENYNSFGVFDRLSYTWNIKEYNFPNDWANSYLVIWNANYCLEKIIDVTRNNQNAGAWDNVKGSGLFYRGYYFLNLAWDFCKAYDSISAQKNLGLPLRINSDFNIPSARSSVKETYSQIINDLQEAASLLPVHSIHPLRPSKGAAYAALSRAYLSMRIYDSAYKYANAALEINPELLDYNSTDVNAAINTPFQPFNKEVIFYTTQSGTYSTTAPPYCSIDTTLYNSYDSNDMRRKVFFRAFHGYERFKGNYSAANNILFTGIATDELYLTRAECLCRSGQVPAAINDINTLLQKRWITGTFTPLPIVSQQATLDIILTERRKELLMRCLRWIDIKRLNKEGRNIIPTKIIAGITYTLPPNDSRYALPLPQDIINITGMKQN